MQGRLNKLPLPYLKDFLQMMRARFLFLSIPSLPSKPRPRHAQNPSTKPQLTSQTLLRKPSLLNPVLSSPRRVIHPALATCPHSTITIGSITKSHHTIAKTVVKPACPTVTVYVGNAFFQCPSPTPTPTPTLDRCNCLLQAEISTITYGCAGRCCLRATPTVTEMLKPSCRTGCAAVCPQPATMTVTQGCRRRFPV